MFVNVNLYKELEDYLNNNVYGLVFKVFSEVGKYEQAVREDNNIVKLINVICSLSSSDSIRNQDGKLIATYTFNISYIVPMKDYDEDIVQTTMQYDENDEIEEVEQVIDEGNNELISTIKTFFDKAFGQVLHAEVTDTTDEDNEITYSITTMFSIPTILNRDVYAGIGYAITMGQSCIANVIQDGLDEQDYIVELDGIRIPFDRVTQYKSPTLDGYVKSNSEDGNVENTESQSQKSWEFIFPSFKDELGEIVMRHLNKEKANVVHILKVSYGLGDAYELVLLGQCSFSADRNKNGSFSLSIIPSVRDINQLNFPPNLVLYDVSDYNATLGHNDANNNIVAYDFSTDEFREFALSQNLSSSQFLLATGAITGLEGYEIEVE